MSRKTRSEQENTENGYGRSSLVAVGVGVLVLAVVAATFFYESDDAQSLQTEGAARQAALASEHSPTLGDPGAKVHIVEFLDPACGTCALFFPMVKQWMAEVPGEIRLSVRHVAFHSGSDYAVRILADAGSSAGNAESVGTEPCCPARQNRTGHCWGGLEYGATDGRHACCGIKAAHCTGQEGLCPPESQCDTGILRQWPAATQLWPAAIGEPG